MESRLRAIADFLLGQQDASAVQPASMSPTLLPYVYILGIEHDESEHVRLRIRLVGTALDRVFNRPLKGRLLEDFIHGPRGQQVLDSFHRCAETHQPLWMRQVVRIGNRPRRFVEGVAVFLKPDRIYGGLTLGDVPEDAESGFVSEVLTRPEIS